MRGRRARMSLAALVVGDAVLAGVALGFSADRGSDQPSQRETVVVTSGASSPSPPDGNRATPAPAVAADLNGTSSPATTPTTGAPVPAPSSTTAATTTSSVPAEVAETPSSSTTTPPATTAPTSTTLAPDPTTPTAARGGGLNG
jgi:hypothetical protein